MIINVESSRLTEYIDDINHYCNDEVWPSNPIIYNVLLDSDVVFFNEHYDKKDSIRIGLGESSEFYPIYIPRETGLMMFYISPHPFNLSFKNLLKELFIEKDKFKTISYTVRENRLYANGLSLAVKELPDIGIIPIYCSETKQYRNNIKETQDIIIQSLERFGNE